VEVSKEKPVARLLAIVRRAVLLMAALPLTSWSASGVLYAGTAPYAGYPTIQEWCDKGFHDTAAGSVCKGPATCSLVGSDMYRFTCPDTDLAPEPAPDVEQAGMCPANPIMPATGEKLQREADYRGTGAHALSLVRSYRSSRIVGQTTGAAEAGLGPVWSHNHHALLKTSCEAAYPVTQESEYRYVFGQYQSAWSMERGGACPLMGSYNDRGSFTCGSDGTGDRIVSFFWDTSRQQCRNRVTNANGCVGDYAAIAEQQRLVPYQRPGCALERTKIYLGDGTVRAFNVTGTATWAAVNGADTLQPHEGGTLYTRADDDSRWQFDATGRLLRVSQRNGWTTSYAYTHATRLALPTQVANQFGQTLAFTYNAAGQLAGVTTPDGQNITYQYDGATPARLTGVVYPGAAARTYHYEYAPYPQLLTGITDETGNRLSTYAYDVQGRGISTEHALGANRHTVSYGAADAQGSQATVTDPLGNARTYTYSFKGGSVAVTGTNEPGEPNAAASRIQDMAGLITQEADFLGVTTLYTWDAARRLKTGQTQAANRPEAQTTQTQWHPTYKLPVQVTEAGRTTAYTYDALGNKLTETITDTATGQARTWAWTYNAQGLNATHTDAAGQEWTYTWDSQGNRTGVRDPLGHETAYTFDAAGRVLTQTGPNRAPLAWTYDARGRVISQTSGADSVVYSYTPAGQIAGLVQSDGLQVTYQYDAAQRLTGASDNRGNSVHYTLDAMGNRTREEVRDASGAIALVTARVINNLNKVAALQGAAGQTTQLGYDANGEPISQTDPLNQTTRQTLDGLRRSTATTFADNTAATQAWNALDQLTQLTDPKGVATQYTYNAFGEVLTETSPDIGTLRYTRDAAGRVTRTEDARGQITQITRDALGRPSEIRYATDHVVSYQYNGAGDITRIDDQSGSTAYEHDNQGRITRKTQDVNDNPANPARFTTAYSYTNGRLSGITYPSGFKVSYSRSAGRITGISVQAPGRNKPVQPFVTDLSHTALGQPKAWNWSNGDAAARTFDTDGRMTGNEFASYIYDAASRITGITQHLWASSTATGTVTTYTTPLNWTVGYDSRSRLTSFNRPGAETSYTYDANSNRLTAIDKITSDTDLDGDYDNADFKKTTSQNLTIEGTSNRLLGFTQTLTNVRGTRTVSTANTNVSYAVDPAGNLTSDGLRAFEYDPANRLSKARIFKDGEEASIRYLHNATGQRVFKGEPTASQTLPSETDLGTSFIDWLKKNFKWLYASAQANTSIGTAYVYGDGEIPSWALMGEYDNGSAKGAGRSEFIWLPTEDGSAIPIGMYRNGKLFAIHSDHLGTPRLMTNEMNQPVWQWPYSAFGNNKQTGILKAAPNPRAALTNVPVLLKATAGTELNLRFPGQYFDVEAGTNYNYLRDGYDPFNGRYRQPDPIRHAGGMNFYEYANSNPLSHSDPEGLQAVPTPLGPIPLPIPLPVPGTGSTGGYDPIRDLFNPNMSRAQSWPTWPPSDPSQPVPSGGDGGRCDKQYARDSAICRGLPTVSGRAKCWKSAADRLAACIAGKTPPDLACP
jgi:RHS repeat-associated protein